MFRSGFSEKKLKVNLKLVINRLKLLEKKKTELAMKERRDIAEYIRANKIDRARIRVEHIIREDYLVEAMEIVEMYADILLARLGLLMASKCLDESLKKPVSSLIWVAMRMRSSVEELKIIHDQLAAYYGKEYQTACCSNTVGTVCDRLMHKLDPSPPPKKLVEQYLIEIARAANIDFTPDEDALKEDLGSAPPMIDEAALIELYDKNIDPPYNGPRGPGGGHGGGGGGQMPAPVPFSYPPSASTPAGQSAFGGASGYSAPPTMASTLPPYSATDPRNPGPAASYTEPPPDLSQDEQAPPLPHKHPAGIPNEKLDLSHEPGVQPNLPPRNAPAYNGGNLGPPVPAPRSASPGLPDLPSVPSSFSVPPDPKQGGGGGSTDDVDFDDLTRRFENLKNRK